MWTLKVLDSDGDVAYEKHYDTEKELRDENPEAKEHSAINTYFIKQLYINYG